MGFFMSLALIHLVTPVPHLFAGADRLALRCKAAPAVPGRRAAPHKAQHRFTSEVVRERFADAHAGKTKTTQPELQEEFTRAACNGKGETGRGSSDGPKDKSESKVRRYGRPKYRDKDLDRGR